MKETVFWSWQSESPSKTNRNLIEKALDGAVRAIARDASIEASPRLDKDTQDVPGAPDIAHTIFEKIEHAAVFVCDVSLINRGEGVRPTPNPNVLVELGYALAKLGWSRIVMVLNEAYGPVKDLPFDLNQKRAFVYRLEEADAERGPARDELKKRFESALRTVFENYKPPVAPVVPTAADNLVEAIERDARDLIPRVASYMQDVAARLQTLKPPPGNGNANGEDDERLIAALAASEPLAVEYGRVVDAIARFNATAAAVAIYRGFEKIHDGYEKHGGGTWYETDFDFHRFMGHELFVMLVAALMQHDRWESIAEILGEDLCVRVDNRSENYPFQCLSVFVKLLDIRNERLHLRKVLLHGEVLMERHQREPLASVSPFDAFVEADFLLFLRAELSPPRSPLAENDPSSLWRPWTGLFMDWKVPAFLLRAERAKQAARLLAAVGVDDVSTFRTRYPARAGNIGRFFTRGGPFHLGKYDVEKFGSR